MSDTHAVPKSGSIWSAVTGARPEERPALALSFVYFFCVLTSYFLIRPLRDQFGAAVGSTNLWPFWLGTFLATLVLTPVFGWLVARYPREKFIPLIYGFFILCLIAFVPAFRAQESIGPRLLGTIFYIWVSVFNLFVVSVFWSFMADLFDGGQSRRLFPVIAVGGTAGSIAGPLIASALPVETVLYAAILMLVVVIYCATALSRWSKRYPNPERRLESGSEVIGGNWWAGLKQTFTSPFLRRMAALMLLGDAIGTVGYALVSDYAGAHYADREARKYFYTQVDLMTNVLVIVFQVSVARWVLSRFGLGVGLVLPALLNVAVLLAVALIGDPAVVAMLVITRAGTYGLYKPAADALYARVDREMRYKGKNAIDTAVWRFGDVLVSGSMAILKPLAIGVAGYALISACAASMSSWFGWRAAHSKELAPEPGDGR